VRRVDGDFHENVESLEGGLGYRYCVELAGATREVVSQVVEAMLG
jgi:hypothetical protein